MRSAVANTAKFLNQESATSRSKRNARYLLLALFPVLILLWLYSWAMFYGAYSIGGGSPQTSDLAIASFVMSSPTLLCAFAALFAFWKLNHSRKNR